MFTPAPFATCASTNPDHAAFIVTFTALVPTAGEVTTLAVEFQAPPIEVPTGSDRVGVDP